ncbi:hypothetical protein EC973_001376 [Apophysomyces ossiformis]|uniref:Carboxymuconolactone decarboxylase-like domain-containing protein n=1 Tax=Apophysomyces ossiformis TaxID=679940 RepID=A0A8H7BYM1_9FUNG|nr:hypothetical protein EC973_001376 [Apophysomyces ossiformis]
MTALNRPEDIPYIYERLPTLNDRQSFVRLREGIFKLFPIVGYPKVINALQRLNEVVPASIKADVTGSSRTQNKWEDVLAQRERGLAMFETTYGQHSQRVMDSLQACHPDMAETAITHLYGPIISDTTVLSTQDTSLIYVAGLMAQNLPEQLKGHWYGAQHHGATVEALEEVRRLVELTCGYYGVGLSSGGQ